MPLVVVTPPSYSLASESITHGCSEFRVAPLSIDILFTLVCRVSARASEFSFRAGIESPEVTVIIIVVVWLLPSEPVCCLDAVVFEVACVV